MLTEMKEAGIIPGAESYFAFLEGFAMAKQPRRASQIMQDFVDNGGEVRLHTECSSPVSVCLPCCPAWLYRIMCNILSTGSSLGLSVAAGRSCSHLHMACNDA